MAACIDCNMALVNAPEWKTMCSNCFNKKEGKFQCPKCNQYKMKTNKYSVCFECNQLGKKRCLKCNQLNIKTGSPYNICFGCHASEKKECNSCHKLKVDKNSKFDLCYSCYTNSTNNA